MSGPARGRGCWGRAGGRGPGAGPGTARAARGPNRTGGLCGGSSPPPPAGDRRATQGTRCPPAGQEAWRPLGGTTRLCPSDDQGVGRHAAAVGCVRPAGRRRPAGTSRPPLHPPPHPACSANLELEYKYVIRNSAGGDVVYWKPGDNYQIKVPVLLEVSDRVPMGRAGGHPEGCGGRCGPRPRRGPAEPREGVWGCFTVSTPRAGPPWRPPGTTDPWFHPDWRGAQQPARAPRALFPGFNRAAPSLGPPPARVPCPHAPKIPQAPCALAAALPIPRARS